MKRTIKLLIINSLIFGILMSGTIANAESYTYTSDNEFDYSSNIGTETIQETESLGSQNQEADIQDEVEKGTYLGTDFQNNSTDIIINSENDLIYHLSNSKNEYRNFYLSKDLTISKRIEVAGDYDFTINGLNPETGKIHTLTLSLLSSTVFGTKSDRTITFKDITIKNANKEGIIKSSANVHLRLDHVNFTGAKVAMIDNGTITFIDSDVLLTKIPEVSNSHVPMSVAFSKYIIFEGNNIIDQSQASAVHEAFTLSLGDNGIKFNNNSRTKLILKASLENRSKSIVLDENAYVDMDFSKGGLDYRPAINNQDGEVKILKNAILNINYNVKSSSTRTVGALKSKNSVLVIDGGEIHYQQSQKQSLSSVDAMIDFDRYEFNNATLNFTMSSFIAESSQHIIKTKMNEISNLTLNIKTNSDYSTNSGFFLIDSDASELSLNNLNISVEGKEVGSIISGQRELELRKKLHFNNVNISIQEKGTRIFTLFDVWKIGEMKNLSVDINTTEVRVNHKSSGTTKTALLYSDDESIHADGLKVVIRPRNGANVSHVLNHQQIYLRNSHIDIKATGLYGWGGPIFKENSIYEMVNTRIDYTADTSQSNNQAIIPFNQDSNVLVTDSVINIEIKTIPVSLNVLASKHSLILTNSDINVKVSNLNGPAVLVNQDFILRDNSNVTLIIENANNSVIEIKKSLFIEDSALKVIINKGSFVSEYVVVNDLISRDSNFELSAPSRAENQSIMNVSGERFEVAYSNLDSDFGIFKVVNTSNKGMLMKNNDDLNIILDVQQMNSFSKSPKVRKSSNISPDERFVLRNHKNDFFKQKGTDGTGYMSGFEQSVVSDPFNYGFNMTNKDAFSLGFMNLKLDPFANGDAVITGHSAANSINSASYVVGNKTVTDDSIADELGRFEVILSQHKDQIIHFKSQYDLLFLEYGNIFTAQGSLDFEKYPDSLYFDNMPIKSNNQYLYERSNELNFSIIDNRNGGPNWKLEVVQDQMIVDKKMNRILDAEMIYVYEDGTQEVMEVGKPIYVTQGLSGKESAYNIVLPTHVGPQLRVKNLSSINIDAKYNTSLTWILSDLD